MALAKRERTLLIVCAVILVGAGIYQFVLYPASQKKNAPSPGQTSVPQNVTAAKPNVAAASEPSAQKAVVVSKVYEDWGRDPFSYSKTLDAVVRKSVSKPKINRHLRGILWKEGKTYVIIDDLILGEGDEENGLKVERIEGSTVVCRENGRTFTLQLKD